jgi:hypothetical protein
MDPEQNPNPNPEPQNQQAPEPTAEEKRITAIEKELENYSDEKIAALERGSWRIKARGKRTELMNEKAMLQLKPVLDAPERESESSDEPEPSSTVRLEAPVSHEYEGAALEYAKDAEAIAKVADIPLDEMNVLFNFVADGAIMAAEADRLAGLHPSQVPGPDISNRRACETILHRRFGNMASKVIEDAVSEFKRLPESVQRWLDTDHSDGRLVSNHPELIIALALKKNGFTRLTPAAAQKELDSLRTQKLDALGKAKIKMLALIAAKGKTGEHQGLKDALSKKSAPKPTPTAESKIRGDIAALRRSEAYFRRDHPAHLETVRQVNALYAKLHGDK